MDITFDEQLTLENRARYYDQAGALMDMIQSHLLQVLALVAMEPIARADAVDLRDAKAQVLRACRPWNDDPVGAGRQAATPTARLMGATCPTTQLSLESIRRGTLRRSPSSWSRSTTGAGRCAVPAAVGQGAARATQGGAGHLQAAAPSTHGMRGQACQTDCGSAWARTGWRWR